MVNPKRTPPSSGGCNVPKPERHSTPGSGVIRLRPVRGDPEPQHATVLVPQYAAVGLDHPAGRQIVHVAGDQDGARAEPRRSPHGPTGREPIFAAATSPA